MSLSYRVYVELRFIWEVLGEMLINALRFTPLGPKRVKNLPNIDGKVVVITGSNTGIGKVTARVLTKLGAKVIMGCRDVDKANKAADEIREEFKNANIIVLKLDLSSLTSVREFAEKVCQQESQIDILINNAGIMMCPKWKTEDGFDMQLGTNHLGHFLLTLLLIERLKKSPNARIINVASIAHIRGEIYFDDINMDKSYNEMNAYAQSKLANVLFSRELANKLSDTNIKVYCLHPGLINTDLHRHLSRVQAFFFNIVKRVVQIDAELGAQTSLYCALEESLNNETGRYYKNCRRVDNMVKNAIDDVSARKLWEISCKLVNIEDKL